MLISRFSLVMVLDPYCDVSVAAIMANRDRWGCDESHETREAANRGGLACSGIQRCNPRHASRALIFSVMTVTANDRRQTTPSKSFDDENERGRLDRRPHRLRLNLRCVALLARRLYMRWINRTARSRTIC